MRLSDMPTPETDALDFRAKDPSKAELANLCRSLEKKLALAVAALKEIENSDDHGYVKLETVNSIAHRVLEQIEEKK